MKKSNLLLGFAIIIMFMITGCLGLANISASSGVDEASLNKIPSGAKTIFVEKKDVSINSFYEEVISVLMSRGHRIMREDKERHYITTEGKDVGQSTLQRMTLLITEKNNICQLKITTEWKAGTEATSMASAMGGIAIQSDWSLASWEVNRLGIAFAESLKIAKEIKEGVIKYE